MIPVHRVVPKSRTVRSTRNTRRVRSHDVAPRHRPPVRVPVQRPRPTIGLVGSTKRKASRHTARKTRNTEVVVGHATPTEAANLTPETVTEIVDKGCIFERFSLLILISLLMSKF